MIASLLPGLRDLRTPLAVGYLWLVVLWLLLHDHVPLTAAEAPRPIASLFELGTLVGATAALAAMSFVAFLLGSILSFDPSRISQRVMRPGIDPEALSSHSMWRDRLRRVIDPRPVYTPWRQLATFMNTRLRDARQTLSDAATRSQLTHYQKVKLSYDVVKRARRSPRNPDTMLFALIDSALEELPAVGIQLQAKNRDLWDTYDRERAEAEFRFGITPPLSFIVVLFAMQSSQYWWLFLLIVPLVLLLDGFRDLISSSSALIQGIVLKMVKPPVLERIDEEIAKEKAVESAKIGGQPEPVKQPSPAS